MMKPSLSMIAWTVAAVIGTLQPEAVAQARFAPPNPQQQACIEAFTDLALYPTPPDAEIKSLDDLVEWGVEKFGTPEAFQAEMGRRQREDSQRRLDLLLPAVRKGHLPSRYLLATYWNRESDLPGTLSRAEKRGAMDDLFARGFPLAAGHVVSRHYDSGFFPKFHPSDGDWRSLPPESRPERVQKILREAENDRGEYFRITRWAAFRGSMSAWESLASTYKMSVKEWSGGRAHRVEAYAWYELEAKRLDQSGWPVQPSVPRIHQAEMAELFESERERSEAVALAGRYVKELWPRRIRIKDSRDTCRIRPQLEGEPDPYGQDFEP